MKEIGRLYDEAREIQLRVIESLKVEDEYVLEISINKLLEVVAESQSWLNLFGEAASISDMNLAKGINVIVDDVINRLEVAKDNC